MAYYHLFLLLSSQKFFKSEGKKMQHLGRFVVCLLLSLLCFSATAEKWQMVRNKEILAEIEREFIKKSGKSTFDAGKTAFAIENTYSGTFPYTRIVIKAFVPSFFESEEEDDMMKTLCCITLKWYVKGRVPEKNLVCDFLNECGCDIERAEVWGDTYEITFEEIAASDVGMRAIDEVLNDHPKSRTTCRCC